MAKKSRKRRSVKIKPRMKTKFRSKTKSRSRTAMKPKLPARRQLKPRSGRRTKAAGKKTSQKTGKRTRPVRRALSVLVTGFGPFPGAPVNPTSALAGRLARIRRPAFADVRLHAHVFPTSYAAVDRDLPRLIAAHRPDAILMFGLHARARHLHIETQARNTVSFFADATGFSQNASVIAARHPPRLQARLPVQRLVGAARSRRVAAKPSRDAGRYVCNYLLWRAIEAAKQPRGPRIAAFVHVPRLRGAHLPHARARQRRLGFPLLLRGAEAILLAVIAAAQSRR